MQKERGKGSSLLLGAYIKDMEEQERETEKRQTFQTLS